VSPQPEHTGSCELPSFSAPFWILGLIGAAMVIAGMVLLRLVMTVPAEGIVAAQEESYVFSPVAGTLRAVPVRIGQEVAEGDILFQLNEADLQLQVLERQKEVLQLRQARSLNDLALKELSIRPAQIDQLSAKERLDMLNRIKVLQEESIRSLEELQKQQLVTRTEFNRQQVEAMKTDLERMQASMMAEWNTGGLMEIQRDRLQIQNSRLDELIRLAEEEAGLLQRMLADLSVRAPISGRVVSLDFRHPGMHAEKGQVLAKIARMDNRYRVKAVVGERNVDLLRIGTRARMRSGVFDSVLEGYVYGEVTSITPEAARPSATGPAGDPTFEVEIRVDQTPYPLVLGSRLRIDFLLGKQPLTSLFLNRPMTRHEMAGLERSP
jgi:multidrug resistance efflux pump